MPAAEAGIGVLKNALPEPSAVTVARFLKFNMSTSNPEHKLSAGNTVSLNPNPKSPPSPPPPALEFKSINGVARTVPFLMILICAEFCYTTNCL